MKLFFKGIVSFFQWLAWIVSILASVFFLVFIIGEGAIQDVLAGRAQSMIAFIPWLLLAIAGCVISFFRKRLGGIFMLSAGIAMVLNFYFHTGWQEIGMMAAYGLPYIIAGITFIIYRK